MARKTARKRQAPQPERRESPAAPVAPGEGEGSRLSRLWFLAAALIAAGYAALLRVDPAGGNAWAAVSPACLLSGYLLIVPAIWRSFRD